MVIHTSFYLVCVSKPFSFFACFLLSFSSVSYPFFNPLPFSLSFSPFLPPAFPPYFWLPFSQFLFPQLPCFISFPFSSPFLFPPPSPCPSPSPFPHLFPCPSSCICTIFSNPCLEFDDVDPSTFSSCSHNK